MDKSVQVLQLKHLVSDRLQSGAIMDFSLLLFTSPF